MEEVGRSIGKITSGWIRVRSKCSEGPWHSGHGWHKRLVTVKGQAHRNDEQEGTASEFTISAKSVPHLSLSELSQPLGFAAARDIAPFQTSVRSPAALSWYLFFP